eukprot:NODE_439_length_8587_cov_0.367224.p6 type:complete len:188 gc:universal NODE_439_length_8587_cov_0.367224:5564-5001(-)
MTVYLFTPWFNGILISAIFNAKWYSRFSMIKPEKSHMNKLFAFKSEDYNKNESKEVENNKDLKLKRKPTVEYNDNSSKNSKGSLNTRKSKIELHQSTSSEFKSEHRKSNDGSSSFLSRQSRGNYTDSEIEQTVSASPTITRQKRSSSSSRPQSFSDSLDMQAYFDKVVITYIEGEAEIASFRATGNR